MAKKSDQYKKMGKEFLLNVWGKRQRGLPAPEIDWSGPIRHEDVLYLLTRYPFLQIINTEADFSATVQPSFITTPSGWVVHDYGDAMSTSPGEQMYGDYSWDQLWEKAQKEKDEGGEGGTTGKGTIVKQAFETAQEMVFFAIDKGWSGIQIVDGSPLMQWAAWVAAVDREFPIEGFEPTEADKEKRIRLKKVISSIIGAPSPKLGL